jgi:hypothetical protein
VRTAVKSGSELLIFVPRAAHSHDLTGLVGARWFSLRSTEGLIGGFGGPRSDLSRIVVSFAACRLAGSCWDSLRSLAPALRCCASRPAEEFRGFFHSV